MTGVALTSWLGLDIFRVRLAILLIVSKYFE